MTRQVLYVAHPVAPLRDEVNTLVARGGIDEKRAGMRLVDENLQRAMRWLSWLRRAFPKTTFIAPWISSILAGADDSDPAQREAGLVDCCAVVERCDGIVLCGGRISSGMRREMEHGVAFNEGRCNKFEVYDLTGLQIEGRAGQNDDRLTFVAWMDGYRKSCTR
jgi:hypothetical protein